MNDVDEFLEHFGVKGMKWGIRNKKTTRETTAINKRKKNVKNRRLLEDKDLKKYIERLNEEKKLKTLTNEDLKPARTVAKKILSENGQKVIKTVSYGASLYLVKTALERKGDPNFKIDYKDAATYLAPKPKNK